MENVIIKSELTCINTNVSYCTKKIASMYNKGINVLDYGLGSGRNVAHLLKSEYNVHGCDTLEQLTRQQANHDILRQQGATIDFCSNLPSEFYNVVLCSFVLNVIESDSIKLEVVQDLYNKQKKYGITYIEVRTDSDIKGAKTKEKYNNGYLIRKGKNYTYQEAISFEKLEKLVKKAGFKVGTHVCNSTKHYITLFK